jgi:hypothetical protein
MAKYIHFEIRQHPASMCNADPDKNREYLAKHYCLLCRTSSSFQQQVVDLWIAHSWSILWCGVTTIVPDMIIWVHVWLWLCISKDCSLVIDRFNRGDREVLT